jgi:hypothetical protein
METKSLYDGRRTTMAGLPDILHYRTEEIAFLRPTQFAVGLREVAAKRRKIEKRAGHSTAFMDRQLPVILGPGRQLYLRDCHHYAIALFQSGVERVHISIDADLSQLDPDMFWMTLAARSWVRPFDGLGERHPFEHMPVNVFALEDDPFRSLAGALRRRGLYAKTDIAYADFIWADFLRCRIASACVADDFEGSVDRAERIIRADPEAWQLPGLRKGAEMARSPATSRSRPGPSPDASQSSA